MNRNFEHIIEMNENAQKREQTTKQTNKSGGSGRGSKSMVERDRLGNPVTRSIWPNQRKWHDPFIEGGGN